MKRLVSLPVAVLLASMVAARVIYYGYGHVDFYDETLDDHFQLVDPLLLETDLLESVLHLHGQPPLFNLFLGVVLKTFGQHHALAFNVAYVFAGIILGLSMLYLQLRLDVPRVIAIGVSTLFMVSPVTVLYENYLYTTYFVATLLPLAALFLHRYLAHQRRTDAFCFFLALAVVVLTRGLFHPVWFLLCAVVVLVFASTLRVRTLAAAVLPLALVVAGVGLQFAHFGWSPNGAVYRDVNLAAMTTMRLPLETRDDLIRQGEISGLNRLSFYESGLADYLPYVPRPAATGIAVLDQSVKSTGAPNWHSLWFARIAAQYGRDARFVLSRYPETYGRSVRDNLRRFFYPADQSDPFIALPPDHPMRPILRMWDLRPDVATNTEVRYVAPSPFAVIAVPASILFGLAFVGRRIRRRTSERHAAAANRVNAVVVAFMVLSILYVAAVAILLSSGDQSRYRFESMPLVCTLLAMLAPAAWRSSRLAVARVHLRPRRS